MSFIDRLMHRVGRDLDRKVAGSTGTAHARFAQLNDDAALSIGATGGTLQLRVRPAANSAVPERSERGEGTLSCNLGLARPYRGATLMVTADAAGSAGLATLTVELVQPDPEGADRAPLARETYSVESRFDASGRARLELVIDLG